MRKILVATDSSPHAEAALDLALTMARSQGATLTLLHVWQLPVTAFPNGAAVVPSPELERDIVEGVKRGLLRTQERVAPSGIPIETHHVSGSAPEEIVRYAREHGFDLIVVGTHGRRGFRRLVLGSVAEQVVRTAEVPVLTVRAAEGARTAA
jgi:nucleotide-binding universal stress UspA family protein